MRGTWVKLIAVASVLSCLLWSFGLGWVIFDYFGGSEVTGAKNPSANLREEAITKDDSEEKREGLEILALGDSLTRGIGDTTGKGYIGYLKEELKEKSDQEVFVNNLGISGQTSAGLVKLVQQKEVQRQTQNADIIVITIGGNDLFHGGETLINLDYENVSKLQEIYLQNLDLILNNLKNHNPKAKVFLIGLYNPFAEVDAELTSKVVKDWNYRTDAESLKYPNIVFIPTYDLFQLKTEDYLYIDRFHPNTEGYKLIAERIASAIKW